MKYIVSVIISLTLGACSQGESAKLRSDLRGRWICSALLLDNVNDPANLLMLGFFDFRVHFDEKNRFEILIDTEFDIGRTASRNVEIEGTALGKWDVKQGQLNAKLTSVLISSMREKGQNVPADDINSFQETVSRPLQQTGLELKFSRPEADKMRFDTVIRHDGFELRPFCVR